MAAIALSLPTIQFSLARLGWPVFSQAIPSLRSFLELFPSIVLAVPKKKVSHSRKAMRSANKGLKDKQNITNCPGCGGVKRAHHICPDCYSSVTRQWKAQNRKNESIVDLS